MIDTSGTQLARIEQTLMVLAQAQEATRTDSWVKILLAALAAAMAAFFFKMFYDYWQRNFKRGPESRLLLAEMKEMYRHFNTNSAVLKKLKAKIPGSADTARRLSALHFEKLKAPVDSIFFDIDTLRLLPERRMKVALYARVKIRNRNTEAQRVIEYLTAGKYDEATLTNYVEEIIYQHDKLEDWMADEILGMDRSWDPKTRKGDEVQTDERIARDLLRVKRGMAPMRTTAKTSMQPDNQDQTSPKDEAAQRLPLQQPDVHTEPMGDPLYPRVEAVDLHRLAELVSEQLRANSNPAT